MLFSNRVQGVMLNFVIEKYISAAQHIDRIWATCEPQVADVWCYLVSDLGCTREIRLNQKYC